MIYRNLRKGLESIRLRSQLSVTARLRLPIFLGAAFCLMTSAGVSTPPSAFAIGVTDGDFDDLNDWQRHPASAGSLHVEADPGANDKFVSLGLREADLHWNPSNHALTGEIRQSFDCSETPQKDRACEVTFSLKWVTASNAPGSELVLFSEGDSLKAWGDLDGMTDWEEITVELPGTIEHGLTMGCGPQQVAFVLAVADTNLGPYFYLDNVKASCVVKVSEGPGSSGLPTVVAILLGAVVAALVSALMALWLRRSA